MTNAVHHTITFKKVSHRKTRAVTEQKLEVPAIRTEKYGKDGIMYRACTFYNDLPNHITIINNIRLYKRKIHQYLIN